MQIAVRAVLFDLDNTLADRDEAFVRWARWFARDQLGMSEPAAIEDVAAALIVLDADGYTPKGTLFRAIAEQYAWQMGDVDALIGAYREQVIAHLPPLDSGAMDLLSALDEAGMPWGIVTNGSSLSQLGKIRKLGLEGEAACIVISEEIGLRKPDQAMFHLAAERLETPPSDILFVGDHPNLDVAGAANAGMQTAWLRRGRTWSADMGPVPPNLTIDSLRELVRAIWGSRTPEHSSC
jgi:putative hydrolase of the HAD superfamily